MVGWSEVQADCRRVFEENAQPMWVSEGRSILDVNQAAVARYGYSRDEFLAMAVDEIEVVDGKHRTKDGSLVDVEIRSFPITFGGKPTVLASVLDVTYRRRTEAQTRHTRTRSQAPGAGSGRSAAQLTGREREVMERVAEGFTNSQIAEELRVGVKSIETYRARVMEKLGLGSRA